MRPPTPSPLAAPVAARSPERPRGTFLVMGVLFAALFFAGYEGTRLLVVEPRCVARCAEHGETFVSLVAGHAGSPKSAACVCSAGTRIPSSGRDVMVLAGAGLGLIGWLSPLWLMFLLVQRNKLVRAARGRQV